MFQTEIAEKIKTRFMFDNCFFKKIVQFEIWRKLYQSLRQAIEDNIIVRMRIACLTPTLITFNAYCFYTSTVVTLTCLTLTVSAFAVWFIF
jgi:hypothetical protein